MAVTPTVTAVSLTLHLIGSSWELIWHLRERAHTKQNRATAKFTLSALDYTCVYVRAADGGAGENLAVTPHFGQIWA